MLIPGRWSKLGRVTKPYPAIVQFKPPAKAEHRGNNGADHGTWTKAKEAVSLPLDVTVSRRHGRRIEESWSGPKVGERNA